MIRLNWLLMRQLRDQRGLQIKEVAAATGIDKRTLGDWEAGDANDAWVGRLYRLAMFYGVGLMDLLVIPETDPAQLAATQAVAQAPA